MEDSIKHGDTLYQSQWHNAICPMLFFNNEDNKPNGMRHIFDENSGNEEIRSDVKTSEIIYGFVKSFLDNYEKKK